MFSYLRLAAAGSRRAHRRLLWRAFAVLAIRSTVLALAGPGRSETQVMRTGRGAEILVLMDRSRSMDDHMLTSDWRKLDPLVVRAQPGPAANRRPRSRASCSRSSSPSARMTGSR